MNRRTVNILTLIVVLLLISLLAIFMYSQRSINQAQDETVQLVEVDHEVTAVNQFYWLTTPEETYFSLDFQNENDEQIYAIVAQEGGDIEYYTAPELITRDDALSITVAEHDPQDILQARLGMLEDQPVWEVTFKEADDSMTYYYLDATSGEGLQMISNL